MKTQSSGEVKAMKLWAIKMLFVWRYRLGYWAWDAFWAAFTVSGGTALSNDLPDSRCRSKSC
jgi:hypothetical protein